MTGSTSDFTGFHILLVDDEPAIRRSLGVFLERRGATVATAGDATEALALLETEPFDLLISDISLPGQSGLDLLTIVRGRWPELPAILITGSLMPGAAMDVSGAVAYLEKPFDLAELARRIEAALLP